MKKVVITGIGAVSGNGTGVNEIWAALSSGVAHRSKISEVHFDPTGHPAYASGKTPIEIVCGNSYTNEQLAAFAGIARFDRYDRHQLFALLASDEAMINSLDGYDYTPEATRFGIAGGTGDGGLDEDYNSSLRLFEKKKLFPYTNLRELPNIFTGYIANTYGLQGPGFVHCTACAASAHAMQDAVKTIRSDDADIMLVVGTEAAISPFGIGSFAAQRAIANESRPYQKNREGFLMGEGAAALVVESYEHARARGANILAEIAGYGASTDGVKGGTITDPDASGGARSAFSALRKAGLHPGDIEYINTHGTGTPTGDGVEIKGILSWAKHHANDILVSSTKSFSGHLLGAAGAYELVLCVLMMKHGMILPTHGLSADTIDGELPWIQHVMGAPVPYEGGAILSNSFGFGGTNASVILKPV